MKVISTKNLHLVETDCLVKIKICLVCIYSLNSFRRTIRNPLLSLFTLQVNSRVTFWSWMKNTFVPGVYNSSWYNGIPFDHEDGFISNRENFLVGMPRLRQVRVLPGK